MQRLGVGECSSEECGAAESEERDFSEDGVGAGTEAAQQGNVDVRGASIWRHGESVGAKELRFFARLCIEGGRAGEHRIEIW